jgi:Ca-activated chloride channel family protein
MNRTSRAIGYTADELKARTGARTALFVDTGTTHMVLPFMTDISLFELYLDSLSTSLMPSKGKDSAKALAAIEDFLKDEPVPGTILFVTDGTEPHALPAFRQFTSDNTHKADVLVIGVGTSQGGPLRTVGNQLLNDTSDRRVYSRLDLNALRSLSSIGISATTLTLNDDDIHWIQCRVQHHLEAVQQRDSKTRWINEGCWLTIPIAAITLFSFRRGRTIRWTSTALAALIVFPSSVGTSKFSWIGLWLTPDHHFEKGEYQKVAERCRDSIWKGLALSRVGDNEAALNEFALSHSAES